TTGGVQDALGLGRGTAGVHDVQRVLGVVGLGRVLGGGRVDDVVPPHVALVPLDLLAGTANDEYIFDGGPVGDGLVDGGLEAAGFARSEEHTSELQSRFA